MSTQLTSSVAKNKKDEKPMKRPFLKLGRFPIVIRKLFSQKVWDDVEEIELFNALKKSYGFLIRGKIGSGAYSNAYYAEKMCNDNKMVIRKIACKVIDRRRTSELFCSHFLPREIKILKIVRHPNIIRVFNICEMGPYISICMEFSEHGDLLRHVQEEAPFIEQRTKMYFAQLASAINYLHQKNIAHRDIKCENVMLTQFDTVKLSDFGFSRKIRSTHGKNFYSQTFCGSTEYAPPEVLRGVPYNPKLFDIWSLGCLLYIMGYGVMLFGGESNIMETVKRQEAHCINFPGNEKMEKLEDLIRQMVQPDVGKRITIKKVLEHNWLNTKSDSAEVGPSQTVNHNHLKK